MCYRSNLQSEMFFKYRQTIFAVHNSLHRHNVKILHDLLTGQRTGSVWRSIHGTRSCRSTKQEISSEPIKFTNSAANMQSKITPRDVNKYQGKIMALSLAVFLLYFCYFRESNDIDDNLNMMLFDQVPGLEEVNLTLVIKQMKAKGLDTTVAEERLKVLVERRLAQEQTKTA